MRLLALVVASVVALPLLAQETRIASDFEIAAMEKQLERSRNFESQLSGRLNLGDLRMARSERSVARTEYEKALQLAENERVEARRHSSMTRYANATSYAALAQAKLGREREAFLLLEEAARYASDDAETWNLYASAMRVLDHPRKAVAAARNAVSIAVRSDDALDRAIYNHALATALIDAGETAEAERLLRAVTESLRSSEFVKLQRDVARQESFEVYSSARGNVAAYVSLLNRASLRLASLYERRGDLSRARAEYERVLDARSDDVTALAALARLASSDQERERRYAEAFEANPFSIALIRQYQRHLATAPEPDSIGNRSTGDAIRKALVFLKKGQDRAAREAIDALLAKHPRNETLHTLRREAEAPASASLPSATPAESELRALLEAFERLTPEQRVTLDRAAYTSVVRFDRGHAGEGQQTVLESGRAGDVRFRFAEPTLFTGSFPLGTPLRLTYRVLGVTRVGGEDALLFEPLRLEPQS